MENDNTSQIPSEVANLKVSHNNIQSEQLRERPIKRLRQKEKMIGKIRGKVALDDEKTSPTATMDEKSDICRVTVTP